MKDNDFKTKKRKDQKAAAEARGKRSTGDENVQDLLECPENSKPARGQSSKLEKAK